MSSALSVGDVVKLKSGGPEMTVTSIGTAGSMIGLGTIECTWFEDGSKKKHGTFRIEMLQIVTQDKGNRPAN
jgi:uncharacterized protein YodC (DUF2158 family)